MRERWFLITRMRWQVTGAYCRSSPAAGPLPLDSREAVTCPRKRGRLLPTDACRRVARSPPGAMRLPTSLASRGLALLAVVYAGAHLATRDSAAISPDERSCQAPCQQLVTFGTSSVPTIQQLRASRALLGQALPTPSLAGVAGPTGGSNWLVPGHLIIGTMPTVADAEALLGAGVSTFCSLIGEWDPARYHEREYPAGLARQSRAHEGPLAKVDAVFLHFGIADYDAARPAELEALVIELRLSLIHI